MTVDELIHALSMVASRAKVLAWDADTEEYQEVSGVVWNDDGSELLIQTDDLK